MDDEDRDRFRKLLSELVQQTGWEVFAWVLMTNHYHLVALGTIGNPAIFGYRCLPDRSNLGSCSR